MKLDSPRAFNQLNVSGSVFITGSLEVTGTVSASAFSGDIETATTASYVELSNVDGFTNYSSSVDGRVNSLEVESGSIRTALNNYTSSADNRLGSLEVESGSIRTAFNNFTGSSGVVSASGQIDHNTTTNYISNEHIDHSTVNITAGSGISGGGDITVSRTLTLDTGSAHFTSGVKTKLNSELVVSGSAVDVKTFLSLENVDNTADIDKPLSTAQKTYVDEVAQGLKARTAARVLVDSNLDATYDNGTAGSGSFLEANSNVAFPTTDGIDSSELNVVGVRMLIAGQTNKAHNGLYVVQTAGNGSTPWKIRRCVECDSSEEIPGSFVFIKAGTVYGNTGWVLLVDNPATFTIGTDDINPTQFSGAGSFLAGDGLGLDGNVFSLDTGSVHFTSGVKSKLNADTVVSSSAQVISLLPPNTVSGSGQIDHNSTTNYVANQHIDHSSVSISAGSGLSGGGNITTSRTLTLDTGSAHFTGGVKSKLNADGVVSGSGQIAINSTTGTLNVDRGGTGQTSFTNGQLLIGNTTGNTLTKATLTGTTDRITITNGAGSITINADATSANTVNKIVARDGSGNFTAGTITATLSGSINSTSATITGGSINGTTIGSTTPSSGVFTSASVGYTTAAPTGGLIVNGNVGVGTTTPSYKLEVNGSFAATTKSFIIDHQSQLGKKLVYGVAEGPEHSVFVRGKLDNNNKIKLPEEWEWLVDENSITVQLTPIGNYQELYVESIDDGEIIVGGNDNINCYYFVQGARKDIDKLETVV
jgi:hypothetical protein